MATAVISHMQTHVPHITVHEVFLTWEHHLYVLVDDDINSRRQYVRHLVGYAGHIRVLYAKQSDFRRQPHLLQARRTTEPDFNTGVVDNNIYEMLRPGVVISSRASLSADSATISTCSGVLVRDSQGGQYMTAATHGIGPSGELFLPRRPEAPIGTAVADIDGLGISLVKLAYGISFENKPSEVNNDGLKTALSRFANEHDIAIGNGCFMETPFTGLLDGKVAGLSFEVEGSRLCNAYTWIYFGQDQNTGSTIKPPDSACGSAMWDENGIVYGFYRFYAERGQYMGFSFATGASRLSEEGLSLVES